MTDLCVAGTARPPMGIARHRPGSLWTPGWNHPTHLNTDLFTAIARLRSIWALPSTVARFNIEPDRTDRNARILCVSGHFFNGSDGTRTRDLRRDRPAL